MMTVKFSLPLREGPMPWISPVWRMMTNSQSAVPRLRAHSALV